MEWGDRGIVLSHYTFGETSKIVSVLSFESGLFKGIVKKSRNPIVIGSITFAHWKARLENHLGTFLLESELNISARIIHCKKRLLALNALCQTTNFCLAERHPYPKIFNELSIFLKSLLDSKNWLKIYALFEMTLLKELGFGIETTYCSVTGSKENITYVSPKTGNAVCQSVGFPYKDKLFSIPPFLKDNTREASLEDLLKSLKLTGYFLKKYFLNHKKAFLTRDHFIETLEK